MLEKDIVNAILKYLNWLGCFTFRVNAGMIFTEGRAYRGVPAGVSDIIGISPTGQFIALEVKTPKTQKKVTKAQQQFLDLVKSKGGISAVVTCIDDALKAVFGKTLLPVRDTPACAVHADRQTGRASPYLDGYNAE